MYLKSKHKKHPNSRKGVVQKRMNAYRERHRYCERCILTWGIATVAVCVHHIDPVGSGGARPDSKAHRESNFISLCANCDRWAHDATKKTMTLLYELKKGEREYFDAVNWIEAD